MATRVSLLVTRDLLKWHPLHDTKPNWQSSKFVYDFQKFKLQIKKETKTRKTGYREQKHYFNKINSSLDYSFKKKEVNMLQLTSGWPLKKHIYIYIYI